MSNTRTGCSTLILGSLVVACGLAFAAVAAFDLDTDQSEDVAFSLVINSFVTLFWRIEVLDETVRWLLDHDYEVVRLDAAPWAAEADLHRDFAAALDFPAYYGGNLDALNDCLRGVATYANGTSATSTGLVLVLTGYDAFAARVPRVAQEVLDIFARQARHAMLIGHRMLCLVRSDDPDIEFEPVGAAPVLWNPAEWLTANRRP
jgi:hypothetical protein